MDQELMNRIIHYLEGIQLYVGVLRTYFKDEDMDEFDLWYLRFYEKFEHFIQVDSNNEISGLMNEYGEFLVDYDNSTLHLCLEAVMESQERRHMYLEGKKEVYLRYLDEVCNIDGREFLSSMSNDEFEVFEKSVFQNKKPTF